MQSRSGRLRGAFQWVPMAAGRAVRRRHRGLPLLAPGRAFGSRASHARPAPLPPFAAWRPARAPAAQAHVPAMWGAGGSCEGSHATLQKLKTLAERRACRGASCAPSALVRPRHAGIPAQAARQAPMLWHSGGIGTRRHRMRRRSCCAPAGHALVARGSQCRRAGGRPGCHRLPCRRCSGP